MDKILGTRNDAKRFKLTQWDKFTEKKSNFLHIGKFKNRDRGVQKCHLEGKCLLLLQVSKSYLDFVSIHLAFPLQL